MIQDNQQKKYWIIQLCYFLFGALCITIPSGYSYAPYLLLLLSLPLLIQKSVYTGLDKNSTLVLAALIFYVAIQGISIIWDGGTLKEFDRPSRALMAASVLLLCLRYPPRFLWLMNGLATGAIGAGIHAIWDRQITGYSRAFEWMMPIQGGDISMSLGLISLCAFMWAIKTQQRKYQIFYFIATIMGILGSIMSQSRGGWVLFPVTLFVTYQIFKSWLSAKVKLGLAATLLGLTIFCLLPQSGVIHRFSEAQHDITGYLSGNDKNKDTSLGLRFEFWKSAVDSFLQKPIWGWGNHGVRISQTQQYERGLITKEAYDFNSHAHNQFLDDMAKRGMIGLIALLGLYLTPLVLFKKHLQKPVAPEQKTLAACGILTVLSTIDYSLSQAFLNHNSGILFYCIAITLLFTNLTSINTFRENK